MSKQERDERVKIQLKKKLIKKFNKGDRNAKRQFEMLNEEQCKVLSSVAVEIFCKDRANMLREEVIEEFKEIKDDEMVDILVRAFQEFTDLPWLHEEATCGLCCLGKSVNKNAVIVDGRNKNRMGHKGSSFMENSHVLNPNIDVTERGVICTKCFHHMESTSRKVLELREMFASSRIFMEREPNRSQSPAVTDRPKALSSSPSFQPKRAKTESCEENPASTKSEKDKSNGHTQTDELQFRGQDSHLQDDVMSSVLKHKISPYAQLTEQEKHQRVRKCMKKISKLVVQICEEEDVPFEEIDNAFRKEYSSSNQLQNDLEENTMIFESPMESTDGQNSRKYEEIESKKSVKIESEIKQEELLVKPGGFICPACSAHFMFEKYFIEHVSGHYRGEHDRNGSTAYR